MLSGFAGFCVCDRITAYSRLGSGYDDCTNQCSTILFLKKGNLLMMQEKKLQDFRNDMFITVDELATIMRISRSMAYQYVKSRECLFNRQQIGKRILIPTKTFFQWYDSLENE
jgi:hypothetical protein